MSNNNKVEFVGVDSRWLLSNDILIAALDNLSPKDGGTTQGCVEIITESLMYELETTGSLNLGRIIIYMDSNKDIKIKDAGGRGGSATVMYPEISKRNALDGGCPERIFSRYIRLVVGALYKNKAVELYNFGTLSMSIIKNVLTAEQAKRKHAWYPDTIAAYEFVPFKK